MTVLSAQTIRRLGLVTPLRERYVVDGVSGGLGPAGYDLALRDLTIVCAGSVVLAGAREYFHMPADVLGVVHDKSTWARRGLQVQNTVIEPGWEGFLTLELSWALSWAPVGDSEWSRVNPYYATFQAGTPICQVVFHRLDEPTETPYSGKYQHQAAGAQPARREE